MMLTLVKCLKTILLDLFVMKSLCLIMFMKYLVRSDVIELFAILVNLYLVELLLIHLFVVLVSVGAFRVLVKT